MNRRNLIFLAWYLFWQKAGRTEEKAEADPNNSIATPATSVKGSSEMEVSESLPQVPRRGVPTLGGRQFWGDLCFLGGWKIQRNVFTGHCRLLDSDDYRFASGSEEDCRRMLRAVQIQRHLNFDQDKVVILIHGIGRSSHSFDRMKTELKKAGFTVVPFEYPSTRISIEQSAEYLKSVILSLPEASEISFVVHSMGGLVVRALLSSFNDARFRSMVMLGTPNRGAELADMLAKTTIFHLIYGPAGQQLVTADSGTIRSLPKPPFPFGVIAGGKGDDAGFNRLLPGDDDGTVTVQSVRLPGAADFLRVPRIHSFLMSDETVMQATLNFLQHGQFDPAGNPQPIPPENL